MVRLLPLLLLAGCPLPKGDDSSAACVPEGDAVPAGVYGGDGNELTVAADGTAVLIGDCSRATVDAVPVVDGAVSWTFTWQSGYGLPVQDTASIEYTDVQLEGTFCGGHLTGTLTFEDGSTSTIDVLLDRAAEIAYCD